jgi:hypothetical protein
MSRSIRAEAVLAVAGAAAMAGCALEPSSEPEISVATQSQAFTVTACPVWGCGTNSPVVDTRFAFHDLSLLGNGRTGTATLPNDAKIAIVADGDTHRAKIFQGRQLYDLNVVDSRIVGTSAQFGVLQGSALIGATIRLTLGGVARYALTITTVRTMSYFVGGGTVEAYTFLWNDLTGGPPVNLCSNIAFLEQQLAAHSEDATYALQELMGMRTFEAVVFAGDRIHSTTKKMDPGVDDTWFNIGCAGHTLAKLLLTRNTIHSQAAGLSQPWERREATMKLYTADYCDSGIAMTVAGQRLIWQGDLMPYFNQPEKIEARWDQTGATCLYAPRMLIPTSPLGASTFPDIWQSVDAACATVGKTRPLPCDQVSNIDPYDYAGNLRVTANPKL